MWMWNENEDESSNEVEARTWTRDPELGAIRCRNTAHGCLRIRALLQADEASTGQNMADAGFLGTSLC